MEAEVTSGIGAEYGERRSRGVKEGDLLHVVFVSEEDGRGRVYTVTWRDHLSRVSQACASYLEIAR